MSLLRRLSRRYYLRHGAQLALAVAGVALGVAVVVAVDLANASAQRAFELGAETIAGRATHEIVGGPAGIDERLYVELRTRHGLRSAAPVVEGAGRAAAPGGGWITLQLLGVDPFAEAPLRPYLAARDSALRIDLRAFLTEPGAVLLTADTARELGIEPGAGDGGGTGAELTIDVGGARAEIRVAGTLDPRDETVRRGLAHVAVADIATAQELLHRAGRLDRIDLRLDDGTPLEPLQALLPPDVDLRPAGTRAGALGDLSSAFRVNLQALSLLALLVGVFLIFNTMQFTVVQRRPVFGIARAIGAPRRAVLALVLREAAAIGVLATALGVLGGIALAGLLLGPIARTIDDFYFSVSVSEVRVEALPLLKGVALGTLVSVLSALPAAIEATVAEPRDALLRGELEERARRIAPRAVPVSGALTALGAVLLWLAGRDLFWSYAGLFAVLVGVAGLVPAGTVALLRCAGPLLGAAFGASGRLAARGAERSLSRTAVATIALTLAVGTTVGLGVMIASFRTSVAQWLGSALPADVYVSVPRRTVSWAEQAIDDRLCRRIRGDPEVRSSATYRHAEVDAADGEPLRLVPIEPGAGVLESFRFVAGGPPAEVRAAFERDGAVIVSEPLAFRRGLTPGGSLELRTDRGYGAFPVAGVFYDYGSERGAVMMAHATFVRHWQDRPVASLALRAVAGVDHDALAARLLALGSDEQLLQVRATGELRHASLAVFDRTFAVTDVLRALCAVVAFIGVLSALLALQLERGREIGVLRAIGATPRQVQTLVLAQCGLLGLCAGVLALPVGGLCAFVLIEVINRRSFGWTLLDIEVPAAVLLEALALAVGAAVLAGVQPAHRLARIEPCRALREE